MTTPVGPASNEYKVSSADNVSSGTPKVYQDLQVLVQEFSDLLKEYRDGKLTDYEFFMIVYQFHEKIKQFVGEDGTGGLCADWKKSVVVGSSFDWSAYDNVTKEAVVFVKALFDTKFDGQKSLQQLIEDEGFTPDPEAIKEYFTKIKSAIGDGTVSGLLFDTGKLLFSISQITNPAITGIPFYEFMSKYLSKVDTMSTGIEKGIVAASKFMQELQDAVTEFSKMAEDFKKRSIQGQAFTNDDAIALFNGMMKFKAKIDELIGADGRGGKFAAIKAAAAGITFDWGSYDKVIDKLFNFSQVALKFVPDGATKQSFITMLTQYGGTKTSSIDPNFDDYITADGKSGYRYIVKDYTDNHGVLHKAGTYEIPSPLPGQTTPNQLLSVMKQFLDYEGVKAKADAKDTSNYFGYVLSEQCTVTIDGKGVESVGYTSLTSYYISSVTSEEARTMQKLTQLMSLLNQYASQVQQSLDQLMKTINNNMRSS